MISTLIVYRYRIISENVGEMIFLGSEEVNMYIQILNPSHSKSSESSIYLQILESASQKKEF